jgi:putative sigma-54 modulation protein
LRFTISGKHIDITEAIKSYAQKKTAKLPRYYDSINRVEVIIEGNKGGNVSVEVIAAAEHNKIFIVKETGENAYKCIDIAVHKLQRQLRRIKSKERNHKHADIAQKDSVVGQ